MPRLSVYLPTHASKKSNLGPHLRTACAHSAHTFTTSPERCVSIRGSHGCEKKGVVIDRVVQDEHLVKRGTWLGLIGGVPSHEGWKTPLRIRSGGDVVTMESVSVECLGKLLDGNTSIDLDVTVVASHLHSVARPPEAAASCDCSDGGANSDQQPCPLIDTNIPLSALRRCDYIVHINTPTPPRIWPNVQTNGETALGICLSYVCEWMSMEEFEYSCFKFQMGSEKGGSKSRGERRKVVARDHLGGGVGGDAAKQKQKRSQGEEREREEDAEEEKEEEEEEEGKRRDENLEGALLSLFGESE